MLSREKTVLLPRADHRGLFGVEEAINKIDSNQTPQAIIQQISKLSHVTQQALTAQQQRAISQSQPLHIRSASNTHTQVAQFLKGSTVGSQVVRRDRFTNGRFAQ